MFLKQQKQDLLYFIKYNVHKSIVHTWISRWFLIKKLFFKNDFTINNHCKFIHHKSHHKPFLNYFPCVLCREYFSIIFNVQKCTLYWIKYHTLASLCKQIGSSSQGSMVSGFTYLGSLGSTTIPIEIYFKTDKRCIYIGRFVVMNTNFCWKKISKSNQGNLDSGFTYLGSLGSTKMTI